MKKVKYVITALCLILLMCGCGPKVYVDDLPYTGTFAAPSSKHKTDAQWNELLSYAEYLAMPAAERSEFADSFNTIDEYKSWLRAVMRIYEAEQDKSNQVGEDGVIDMEDIDP